MKLCLKFKVKYEIMFEIKIKIQTTYIYSNNDFTFS